VDSFGSLSSLVKGNQCFQLIATARSRKHAHQLKESHCHKPLLSDMEWTANAFIWSSSLHTKAFASVLLIKSKSLGSIHSIYTRRCVACMSCDSPTFNTNNMPWFRSSSCMRFSSLFFRKLHPTWRFKVIISSITNAFEKFWNGVSCFYILLLFYHLHFFLPFHCHLVAYFLKIE